MACAIHGFTSLCGQECPGHIYGLSPDDVSPMPPDAEPRDIAGAPPEVEVEPMPPDAEPRDIAGAPPEVEVDCERPEDTRDLDRMPEGAAYPAGGNGGESVGG